MVNLSSAPGTADSKVLPDIKFELGRGLNMKSRASISTIASCQACHRTSAPNRHVMLSRFELKNPSHAAAFSYFVHSFWGLVSFVNYIFIHHCPLVLMTWIRVEAVVNAALDEDPSKDSLPAALAPTVPPNALLLPDSLLRISCSTTKW